MASGSFFSALREQGGGRLARAGLVLILGWLALEIALAKLFANSFGWGLTLALHSIKGGFGLVLLGYIGMRALMRFGQKQDHPGIHRVSEAGFGLLSAILIALPGIAPALLGLALYSPSLRLKVLGWWRPLRKTQNKEITLEREDWKELRARRPRKRLPRPAQPE